MERRIKTDNERVISIIDRFGEDVETYAYDMENFKAEVDVAVNKIFYMWIFGFEGLVKIKSPDAVRNGYNAMVKKVYEDLNL